MTRDRPTLCDTTLRDGQQTQGVSFSTPEKIQIAQAPDRLGLDYIEGGWPGANPTDNTFFETVPPTRATMTAFAGASEGSSSGFSRPFSRRAGHRDRKPAFREGRTPGRQVLQPLRRIRHSHRLHRAAQFREDKHPEPARSQLPPAGEPPLQPDNFTFAGAPYPVPCVFQVWARRGTERELAALPRTHPDFSFTDRSGAEFAFQRVGIRAGAVKTGFDSLAAASHHFIRANIPVSDLLEIFEDLDFAQVKSRTTGDPSISKTELVALYTAARSGAGGLSNSCRTGSRTDGT